MSDANDYYVVGVVLGQWRNKVFYAIYQAGKVLNGVQLNYATTEKEMLAIVYALENFRLYLVGSKIIVYNDHSSGLFTIKELKNYRAIELQDLATQKNWIVNGKRLKIYLSGDIERLITVMHLSDS